MPDNLQAFEEAHKLQQSALLEFFILDFSNLGGDVWRFFSGTDSNAPAVTWQGNDYLPFPCQVTGIDIQSRGPSSRPVLSIANTMGLISSLCLQFKDCVGVEFIRKRTFAKFLDGQPDADPTAEFPQDVYVITQKTSEDSTQVSFEMSSRLEVDNLSLPRRKIVAGLCLWKYRGPECGYTANTVIAEIDGTLLPASPRNPRGLWSAGATYALGDYVYTVDREGIESYYYCFYAPSAITGAAYGPTNVLHWKQDQCCKLVSACMLRHGNLSGGLPFGGYPALVRLPF